MNPVEQNWTSLLPANMAPVVCPLDMATKMPGRRSYHEYLDFGVRDATEGRISAQFIRTTGEPGDEAKTGWHYHTLDVQLAYILEGWAEIQFEDQVLRRVEAGTFLLIPGGHRHNELRISNPYAYLEIHIGTMGTVACENPALAG